MTATVTSAADLVPLADLRQLQRIQPDAFSAATFRLPDGRTVVVYNPLHSDGRTRSDVAHELAHVALQHETRTVERIATVNFFTCDPVQEEEANWLAGCLLLPRLALVRAARLGWSADKVAKVFEVTQTMARYRLNVTGALRQVQRLKRTPLSRPGS